MSCPPRIVSWVTNSRFQAVVVLLTLGAAVASLVALFAIRPYDGMSLDVRSSSENPPAEIVVGATFPNGPADRSAIQVGDRILSIAGYPLDVYRMGPLYPPDVGAGDVVEIEIERASQTLAFTLVIGRYSDNPPLLALILGLRLTVLSLWAVGAVLYRFTRPDDVGPRLIGLAWLVGGVAMGANSPVGWIIRGTTVATTITTNLGIAAFVIAHLYFPVPILAANRRRRLANAVTALALLGSSLVLVEFYVLNPMGLSLDLHRGGYGFEIVSALQVLGVLAGIGLLARGYLATKDPDVGRQASIILWATGLSAAPYLAVELVNRAHLGQAGTPVYGLVLLSMNLVALAYAYVIYQRRLVHVDFIINQVIVLLVKTVLTFAAAAALLGIVALAFDLPITFALAGGVLATLTSLASPALHEAIQRRVNQVLYGSHYDFYSVTSAFSSRFAQAVDRERLVSLLTRELADQMGVRETALFLRERNPPVLQPSGPEGASPQVVADDDELCRALLAADEPVDKLRLRPALSSDTKVRWECLDWAQLLVPLVFEGRLQGVFVLGGRHTGDVYSDQDVQIIATVARQAALAYQNVCLVGDLRQALAAAEKAQQRLLTVREEERRTLAWELHDGPVQDLIGLGNRLSEHRSRAERREPSLARSLEQARQEATRIMRTVRETCSALRSDALDVMGLGPAMTEHARGLMEKTGAVVYLDVPGQGPWLDDPLGITLLRVFQEALNNAVEHAQAQEVWVCFRLDGTAYELRVWDEGCGFAVPERLERLALEGHFGLVTMRERVAAIGGNLGIRSAPGQGTEVRVWGKVEEGGRERA